MCQDLAVYQDLAMSHVSRETSRCTVTADILSTAAEMWTNCIWNTTQIKTRSTAAAAVQLSCQVATETVYTEQRRCNCGNAATQTAATSNACSQYLNHPYYNVSLNVARCAGATDNTDSISSVMQYWNMTHIHELVSKPRFSLGLGELKYITEVITDTATDRSASVLHDQTSEHIPAVQRTTARRRYCTNRFTVYCQQNFIVWSPNINMRQIRSQQTRISQSIIPAKFITRATLLDQSGNMNTVHYKNNGTLTCYTLHTKCRTKLLRK